MRYLDFSSSNGREHDGRVESLVLALDVSGSMEDSDWPPSRLVAAMEAAIALILRKCRIAPEDRVGVVAYGTDAWCVSPLDVVSVCRDRLCDEIRLIETGGGTNITAALTKAGQMLSRHKATSKLSRLLSPATRSGHRDETKRIVLLTDGGHNIGKGPKAIARRLKNDGVCIDCVGIGGAPDDVDEELLRTIASTHNANVTPRYAFIGDKSDLIEKFEQLAGRITR